MKIVIDIPDDKIAIEYGEVVSIGRNNDKELADYIFAGTPLPKGHGRLIDADAFERRCMFDSDIEDMQDVIYALRDYKPIIEEDKGDKE